MAKPALILVGADKGGIGKTTVARTLLDYCTAHNVPTRAFDTETPKGTLKRFHRDVSEVVDATAVADQMRIIDTLSTTDATVTIVDVRAGLMSPTLHALRDIGFLEAVKKGQITFVVFHILGSSIASLNEIEETAPFTADAEYFLVKNFINNTNFFEWDQATTPPISRKRKMPWSSIFRSSTRWPMSRSNWPPFRSSPLSPTRTRRARLPITHSFCAAMCGIGSAMCGPNTIA
jgi:hypothetical protein